MVGDDAPFGSKSGSVLSVSALMERPHQAEDRGGMGSGLERD